MITDSGVPHGGSTARGIKIDKQSSSALKRRQQKRRDIEDVEMFVEVVGDMITGGASAGKM